MSEHEDRHHQHGERHRERMQERAHAPFDVLDRGEFAGHHPHRRRVFQIHRFGVERAAELGERVAEIMQYSAVIGAQRRELLPHSTGVRRQLSAELGSLRHEHRAHDGEHGKYGDGDDRQGNPAGQAQPFQPLGWRREDERQVESQRDRHEHRAAEREDRDDERDFDEGSEA